MTISFAGLPHSIQQMQNLVSVSNPLMNFVYALEATTKNNTDRISHGHFKSRDRSSASASLCRGARVAIDCNVWQEKGLFNSSLGTVLDSRFSPGQSPLNSDLPDMIIVHMDYFSGPVWCSTDPMVVPITCQ